MAFVLTAALANTFKGAFSSASKVMGDLQQKSAALGKNAEALKSFKAMQDSVGLTAGKLNEARARVRELGEQMRNTANPTAAMKNAFSAAHERAYKLQEALASQRRELGQLKGSLGEAGIDTRNFAEEQAKLAEQAKKLEEAQGRLRESQGRLDEAKEELSLGNIKGDVLASAGIVLAFQQPLNAAAEFEQAMAKVAAVSLDATEADMKALATQAKQLGRETQFSASEAAAGQELLVRAGLTANQTLAAMPGLLNMAAAEGMGLSEASDIAAETLKGFNLSADQATRVADVLAKASASSNTSISTLGESMKNVAPLAASLNIPLEDTAAMLGILGNSGIKGAEAGTALKIAFLRLSQEPKATAEALEHLGVKAKDELTGNLRTMPDLMKAISKQMEGMGAAEKS